MSHHLHTYIPLSCSVKRLIQANCASSHIKGAMLRCRKCFVSAKFGPLMIFSKLCFAYKNAEAIDYHEKSLDLWKDADPGTAEVEDARERLAGIQN